MNIKKGILLLTLSLFAFGVFAQNISVGFIPPECGKNSIGAAMNKGFTIGLWTEAGYAGEKKNISVFLSAMYADYDNGDRNAQISANTGYIIGSGHRFQIHVNFLGLGVAYYQVGDTATNESITSIVNDSTVVEDKNISWHYNGSIQAKFYITDYLAVYAGATLSYGQHAYCYCDFGLSYTIKRIKRQK